ncbi:MAG TPA: DUF1731 domain-containing protein [Kofleriaceae bacterium]|nr:DUF1731 domain-containing protein [Kofleriaceae bacterium]
MKIVIPGGTGQLGRILARAFEAGGHRVVILGRSAGAGVVPWDGETIGPWADELSGADAVINLAGRSVNCRYSETNLREMLDSRVRSTAVVGLAIARARRPPRVWLQMSSATIYAHSLDRDQDELTGVFGGDEPGVPAYWKYSVDIARSWEAALDAAPTPHTRKVALRTAMVMSPDAGGVLDVLCGLVRRRVGGPAAGGRQYVSWIHDHDFVRAVDFLIARDDLAGPINVCAPGPLPQREHMAILRRALGVRVGLPATRWMLSVGAWAMRSDPELLLKSRRVVPGRLRAAGFGFVHAGWESAAADLVARWRAARGDHARAQAPALIQPPPTTRSPS